MIKEEYYHIYSKNQIDALIKKQQAFLLKAKRPVLIGTSCLLKVNTNIGVSSENEYDIELNKLQAIAGLEYRPDSMMDHTIVPLKKPLWKSMVECFDGAVGTLPHYLPYEESNGINKDDFFDNLNEMARGGVSFVTLHPTADLNLYKEAVVSRRFVPTTSRGGFVLLSDQLINNRSQNLVAENFERIMGILHEYGMALSVGSVFRPATIHEALDSIHLKETQLQKYYIDLAKRCGVSVQMEGIGHISFDKMRKYADFIRGYGAPLMPLGPMPSDEIIGFDHITNGIGATMMASTGVVGMINSVTREEHTGDVPAFDSILEGLKTAIVAAHCYNISKFTQYKTATETIGLKRSRNKTCVMNGGIFNYISDSSEIISCSRCKRECPLKTLNI